MLRGSASDATDPAHGVCSRGSGDTGSRGDVFSAGVAGACYGAVGGTLIVGIGPAVVRAGGVFPPELVRRARATRDGRCFPVHVRLGQWNLNTNTFEGSHVVSQE